MSCPWKYKMCKNYNGKKILPTSIHKRVGYREFFLTKRLDGDLENCLVNRDIHGIAIREVSLHWEIKSFK